LSLKDDNLVNSKTPKRVALVQDSGAPADVHRCVKNVAWFGRRN
jgi:hypothetical protein